MQSITQPQIDAAQEFANTVVAELRTDKGVHAETAVASVARMAGTFLFRSFGFQLPDVEPGGVVLSEQANEAGPRLIQILAGAHPHGTYEGEITIDGQPFRPANVAAAEAAGVLRRQALELVEVEGAYPRPVEPRPAKPCVQRQRCLPGRQSRDRHEHRDGQRCEKVRHTAV